MSLDPLEKHEKYPRELREKYFGPRANGKEAQELKEKYPIVYREIRREHLGETLREQNVRLYGPKPVKVPTTAELSARNEFSEAEVNRYLIAPTSGTKDNLAEMHKDDPAKYQRFVMAAISYGKNVPERTQRPAAVKPVEPEKFDTAIPENLRVEFNYKVGEKTTRSGLERMATAYGEIQAKKALVEQAARDAETLKASGLRRTADGKFEKIVVDPAKEPLP